MSMTPERELASLLVSRATFGARPGDAERVAASGTKRWLDEQLHPERIDDSAFEETLAVYPDLRLSASELIEKYPRNESSRGASRNLLLQLSHAKLRRVIRSERQLQEVLTDFWFNHFNVYARKNHNVVLSLPSYERDAIRPRVFGKFEDLLRATAEHPAMLLYLDNWINFKEGFDPREEIRSRRGRRGRRKAEMDSERPEREEPRKLGLNENYARELLELHTLGVDGGYRQEDVLEVARAFTGWSVVRPRFAGIAKREEGSFFFADMAHDPGAKTVLGKRLTGKGAGEGLEVLEMLSRHPSTARFLSTKLARRFVAEEPPPSLVDEMTKTYLETGGDLRALVRTVFLSPAFVEAARKAELVKTPLELVASALRAASAESPGPALVRALFDLGMPLYLCQPPTGYDQGSTTWLSAGNLLSRVRFALDLGGGRIPGVEGVGSDMALTIASPAFQRH